MRTIISLLLFLFISSNLNAKLPVEIDWSFYNSNDGSVEFAFYYSIASSKVKYNQSDNIYNADIKFNVIVKNNLKTVIEDTWVFHDNVEKLSDKILYGKKNYFIPHGQYSLIVELVNLNDTTQTILTSKDIVTPRYNKSKFSISTITLATVIQNYDSTESWKKTFRRKDLSIVPNPSRTYFSNRIPLHAYFEIYNSDLAYEHGFDIKLSLEDGTERKLISSKYTIKDVHDLIPQIIEINLDSIPTGSYYVVAEALDQQNTIIEKIKKKVFIVNRYLKPRLEISLNEDQEYEQSPFASMIGDRLKTEIDQAKLLAEKTERLNLESLSTEIALRRALYVFWKKRKSPESRRNERYYEFKKDIKYANAMFMTNDDRAGWRTDRGKIIAKYGQPSVRDRKVSKNGIKHYEIWSYDVLKGGSKFYFVDVFGAGEYMLVHSTIQSEAYNESWFQQYVDRHSTKKDYELEQESD